MNDHDLVFDILLVREVIRPVSIQIVHIVDDAWLLHRDVPTRLEINRISPQNPLQEFLKLQPLVHDTVLPTA